MAFAVRAEVQCAPRRGRVSSLVGPALVPGRAGDDQGVRERGRHRSDRLARAREFVPRGRPVQSRPCTWQRP